MGELIHLSASDKLKNILGHAYAWKAMSKGGDPARQFVSACQDPAFKKLATDELTRLQGIKPEQCFISAQHKQFLTDALAQVQS